MDLDSFRATELGAIHGTDVGLALKNKKTGAKNATSFLTVARQTVVNLTARTRDFSWAQRFPLRFGQIRVPSCHP